MPGSYNVVRTNPATVGTTYQVEFTFPPKCGDLTQDQDIKDILAGRHAFIKYEVRRAAGQAKPTGFAEDEMNLAELRRTLLEARKAMRSRPEEKSVIIEYTLLKGKLTYTRKLQRSR